MTNNSALNTDNPPTSKSDSEEAIAYTQRITQLDRLHLFEDPFKSSADPRYLYIGPEHLAPYRQIQGVIVKRRGLVLITSDPGHGKTSLAQYVYTTYSLEPNVQCIYIPRAWFKSPFAMIQTICNGFDKLEVPRERSYEAQLESFKIKVIDAYRAKQNIVIILDDAQDMPKFGLNLIHELYNFDAGEKVIQTIVFGQSETTAMFKDNTAVNSRIFSKSSINSLSMTSALNMVNFRLRVAGRVDPLIEDDAFQLLYDYSLGIPRDIVAICAQAMDIALVRGLDFIDKAVMEDAIAVRNAQNA
jgi:type II secretory pathway predicted ATPase ExeA